MKFSFLNYLMLALLAFSACQKTDVTADKSKIDWDIKKDDKDACFGLVYPISYTMPDGSTVTGNNEDAVNSALKAWYTAHPDSKEKYALVYPVTVKFKDDSTKSIANEGEMILLKKGCDGKDSDACFWLIYPVSYTMPDGTTVSGNGEDAVNSALKAWYTAHPDSKEKYTLVYPVTVKFKDGSTETVQTENDMILLKKGCGEDD